MGMGTRKYREQLGKMAVAAAMVVMPMNAVVAHADTKIVSESSFETKYQQNAKDESALLRFAQSFQTQTARTIQLRHEVYLLNQEISALYAIRQQLIRQVYGHPSYDDAARVSGHAWDALGHVARTWKVNVISDLRSSVPDKDDRNDDERHQGHGHQSRADVLVRLESTLLIRLDNAILTLQQMAIRDVKEWIDIELKLSNPQPTPPAGLSVWASTNTVATGGAVTFTLQLLDSNHHALKLAGVKVNFALVAPNTDGTLTSSSSTTDGMGRVSVKVNAGWSPGTIQLAAWVDGTANTTKNSPIVRVLNPASIVTHLVLSSGTIPKTLTVGQTIGGNTTTVSPQNVFNQIVAGDRLRITTSNPSVLALPNPDASDGKQQTLPAGNYQLPVITAKAAGTATLTITDISASYKPKLSFKIAVEAAQPVRLVSFNPQGTQAPFYISTAGVVGPFRIAVTDAYGNVVPTTHTIQLTAAQVNQLIGAGSGVRVSPSGPELSVVTIAKGQTGVSVYIDGANVGTTTPTNLLLGSIIPLVQNITVKDSRTIEITYNEDLDSSKVPSVTDYTVFWGSGSGTPQSVQISHNTVTLKLWGKPISHGASVWVSYNPGTDANAVRTVWGMKASYFTNLSVNNPLK
jgi:hypothetical protein